MTVFMPRNSAESSWKCIGKHILTKKRKEPIYVHRLEELTLRCYAQPLRFPNAGQTRVVDTRRSELNVTVRNSQINSVVRFKVRWVRVELVHWRLSVRAPIPASGKASSPDRSRKREVRDGVLWAPSFCATQLSKRTSLRDVAALAVCLRVVRGRRRMLGRGLAFIADGLKGNRVVL